MRGADVTQAEIFSYRTLEERIPRGHSLRKLRALVDGILVTLHAEFKALYADSGRPSIPPGRLLRASLIQTLYTIRPERQLVQHIEYNLLYRWFVGLDMDDPVWDHSSFTRNRDRLLNETVARAFSGKVLGLAEWQGLVSFGALHGGWHPDRSLGLDEEFQGEGWIEQAAARRRA